MEKSTSKVCSIIVRVRMSLIVIDCSPYMVKGDRSGRCIILGRYSCIWEISVSFFIEEFI